MSLTIYPHVISPFFLTSQGEQWDSNNGSNFYARVSQLPPGVVRGPIPTPAGVAALSSGGGQGVEDVARRNQGQLYFTYPEKLVAGQTAMLYMNRRNRCGGSFFSQRKCGPRTFRNWSPPTLLPPSWNAAILSAIATTSRFSWGTTTGSWARAWTM